MKNIFTTQKSIFLNLLVMCSFFANAQIQGNVTTPRGSSVTAWILPELSNADRANFDSGTLSASTYNNSPAGQRTLLYQPGQTYSSTYSYNCHGYAWHVVEGGANRWIGYGATAYVAENIYMTDGSYIQVCSETFPAKVSWPQVKDHSAITTSTPGRWRSKWGPSGWVQHGKEDQPYGPSANCTYWVSTAVTPSATGPLCSGTRTFTMQNVPGASYNWTVSSQLSIVSGAGTNQLTVQRNGTANGNATVSVQMNTACASAPVTTTANLIVGLANVGGTYSYGGATYPVSNSGNGISVSNSSPNIYISLNHPSDPNATYAWTITGSSSSGATLSASGKNASVYVGPGKYLNFYCRITTPCGSMDISFSCYNYSSGGFRLSTYPNPADGELTVTVMPASDEVSVSSMPAEVNVGQEAQFLNETSSEIKTVVPVNYQVKLWDRYSRVIWQGRLKDGKVTFPTSNIPNGLYFLRMEGEKTVTEQIIVQH